MKYVAIGIVVLVLMLLGACKRREAARASASVEVLTDPAQVDAARKAYADSRESELRQLLEDPSQIRPFNPGTMELVTAQRQRSEAALIALRDRREAPAEKRIAAVLALHYLGHPAPADLLASLGTQSPEAALALLLDLDELYKTQFPDSIQRFVITSIDSSHPRVRGLSIAQAGRHRLTEAAAKVQAAFRQGNQTDHEIARATAQLCPSEELLMTFTRQLPPAGPLADTGSLAYIAEIVRSTSNPELSYRAADSCARYLQSQPDQRWFSSDVSLAVEAISAVTPPQRAQELLERLVLHAKWRSVRYDALEQLRKLNPAVAQAAQARAGLPEQERTAGNERKGNPEQTAAICEKHGLLTKQQIAQAQAAARSQPDSSDSPDYTLDDVRGLMYSAKRFIAFDTETGMVPTRHDLLILDFAKASGGQFTPEAVLEQYAPGNSDKGTYTVTFIHQNRLYRFHPEDLGDWYDVPAVVQAINRALRDAAVPEQFVAIRMEDQCGEFMFAVPSKLQAAAPELGLTLESNLDAARQQGKAFEDKVVKELQ